MATSNMAIAALVVGIIGLLGSWFPVLGALLPVVAIILGIVALFQIKKEALDGKGMAIAGIVLGGLGLIFQALVFVGLFAIGSWITQNNLCVAEDFTCTDSTIAKDGEIKVTLKSRFPADATITKAEGDNDCPGASQGLPVTIKAGQQAQLSYKSQKPFTQYGGCTLTLEYETAGTTKNTQVAVAGPAK